MFFKTYTRIGDSMSKKEEFKEFVKNNTYLINYVKNNEMTWQKFYEMYDLYGESDDAWREYKNEERKSNVAVTSFTDFLAWLKTIDLDSVQEGINNVGKVINVIGDLSKKDLKDTYEPRPLYKHFDD